VSDDAPSHRLGAHTRRLGGGRVLVGGWPPRQVRLSTAGAAALDDLLAGRDTAAADLLAPRLRECGLIDPVATAATARVSFVVPCRDGGPRLGALVTDLLPYGEVIVVDDGSVDGSVELARQAGARVAANDGEPGPAGARNHGRELTRTEFVAFVDADCRVRGDWARPLAALLEADQDLALVAPRVRGAAGPGRLARWERTCSPLDMGAMGGLVGPGRRVSFVPSAALVARRSALEALGGFDPSLRFGEDVDHVWRAVAAGWSVRYAPEVEVEHPARARLSARARQHFDYGTSAALLERRHPGAAMPLRLSRLTLPPAILAAGPAGVGLLAGLAIALLAAAKQDDPTVRPAVVRLAFEGQLGAGRGLARATVRDWLPLALLASLRWRRGRRFALTALAADLAVATAPDPAAANVLLRFADNAAYCAGLWRGAVTARSPRALMPQRADTRIPKAKEAGRDPADSRAHS
jgi:mycofactocin system glycosyltransferase